jgi:hypothetical protein
MKITRYSVYVTRRGIYWRWAVYSVFQSQVELFAEGLCFRYKTALKRGNLIKKQEDNFWKQHKENLIATLPPLKFRRKEDR